jgi:hypothetical protein
VTRMRVGLTVVTTAALLAMGAPAAFGQAAPTADIAAGNTGAQLAGTTGAQQATTCPTPKLKGLPKTPKFTNATIHFTLTGITPGSAYIVKAGDAEVLGGTAAGSVVKNKFLLPDQGAHDGKVMIAAIIDVENCANAPWKVEKRIPYKATVAPPAATPTPAVPAGAPAAAVPVKPVPTPPIKLPKLKLPKPITELLPPTGPPPSRRTWLTPIDGGARLDQKLSEPVLSRLERRVQKASSSNALLGLGIVGGLFVIATVGGFLAFRHRDQVSFERAQLEQLKHLEEGDPGLGFSEDPDAPLPAEAAPFAAEAVDEAAVTEPIPAVIPANGGTVPPPVVSEADRERHRAEVESELQRILNEAGIEAELEGILGDARAEAERSGIALDPDLMLHALCEEINGSAKLSDTRRTELRDMFAGIIAEEAQQPPAQAEQVPAQ